ncbi:MAG TPA: 4-(cytidine 5'-diphospho)-2-C-methyl-D-erythritol kinase [Bacteroidales bacterium]|nr:4-(cytidine 5'-diphospho)-2-C-methyl-D-erythritol kinase [Bacteroidales bacterium]
MIFFPNAKINLGLFITEKRADGYHNLESVFYPIAWSDILEIKEQGPTDPLFTTTGLAIDSGYRENLCYRAYQMMRRAYDLPPVAFHLHKIIPAGAGLGGGSSDGAFTLKGLNELFEIGLDKTRLRSMASELGSDCPFFIDNQPAFVWETGNQMETISLPIKNKHLVVVVPPLHIPTARAYQLVTPRKSRPGLKQIITDLHPKQWPDKANNDFEEPLAQEMPQLLAIKQGLYDSGALYASLSGSGSAIYGIFEEKPSLPDTFSGYRIWEGKLE